MSETSGWWQCGYGKVAPTGSRGPVVTGSEHRCTCRSLDVPPQVAGKCFPHVLGIGMSDQSTWSDHAWKSGGILLSPQFAGGDWHLIAARVRGRSEAGEDKPGRLYTEAKYLAAPLRLVRDQFMTLDLPAALVAAPPESVAMEMEKVQPADAAWTRQPLPTGWMEQTWPLVRPLLAGERVSVQDWETTPEQFYQRAVTCLACLPAEVRWRIPMGCGMFEIQQHVALGQGMRALGGVRLVGGQWKAVDEIDQEGLRRADAYLEAIAELAAQTPNITLVDLARRVDQRFEEIRSWRHSLDALNGTRPPEEGADPAWSKSLQLAAEHLVDHVRLKRLAAGIQSDPHFAIRADEIQHDRDQLIVDVVARLASPESVKDYERIAPIKSWKEAWQLAADVDPQSRAVAMLLGLVDLQATDIVPALTTSLPESWHDQIQQVVGAAVARDASKSDGLSAWAEVMYYCKSRIRANWLKRYVASRQNELFCLAWALLCGDPTSESLNKKLVWFRDQQNMTPMKAFCQGKRPIMGSISHLMQLLSNWTRGAPQTLVCRLLQHMIQHAARQGWYVEAILLNARRVEFGGSQLSVFPLDTTSESAERRSKVLADLMAHFSQVTDPDTYAKLLKILLCDWDSVRSKGDHALWISEVISHRMSRILLGEDFDAQPQVKEPAYESVARSALPDAMRLSARVSRAVMLECTRSDGGEVCQWLRALLQDPRWIPAGPESLLFLRRAAAGDWHQIPEVTSEEALALLQICERPLSIGSRVRIDSPGQLRACLAVVDSLSTSQNLEFTSGTITAAIQECITDATSASCWKKLLNSRGIQDQPVWRLMPFGGNRGGGELTALELPIVKQLPPGVLLKVMSQGYTLPEADFVGRADEFTLNWLWQNQAGIKETDFLAEGATRYQVRSLASDLINYCFVRAARVYRVPVYDLSRSIVAPSLWRRVWPFGNSQRITCEKRFEREAKALLRIMKQLTEQFWTVELSINDAKAEINAAIARVG